STTDTINPTERSAGFAPFFWNSQGVRRRQASAEREQLIIDDSRHITTNINPQTQIGESTIVVGFQVRFHFLENNSWPSARTGSTNPKRFGNSTKPTRI